ncbi:hypothetical protein DDR33_24620 [Pararcticibacter amylolyticus]|uniref:Uncharacterized protein n=2 Tax=Pararcticibacter amylolyticus TaxID=2173175 RepID=A0A2U2P9H0_9SPHI|nr:hypothetical protein DDR33_24620 [Pararcticibacter amylolyticus]
MVVMSCSSNLDDTFNSEVLVSSKLEKVYINTLNWGLTDDNQLSAISSNVDKLRKRSDTLGTVKGLEPFIYTFKTDTLSLYFDGEITYQVQDHFKTIHIKYIVLNKKEYRELRTKAYNNEEGYHSVPKRPTQVGLPADMPKPPSN